jgi:hypothetical protein
MGTAIMLVPNGRRNKRLVRQGSWGECGQDTGERGGGGGEGAKRWMAERTPGGAASRLTGLLGDGAMGD